MAFFKRKHQEPVQPDEPTHDFAQMVKSAREADPTRFKRVQHAFAALKRSNKPKDSKTPKQ